MAGDLFVRNGTKAIGQGISLHRGVWDIFGVNEMQTAFHAMLRHMARLWGDGLQSVIVRAFGDDTLPECKLCQCDAGLHEQMRIRIGCPAHKIAKRLPVFQRDQQ